MGTHKSSPLLSSTTSSSMADRFHIGGTGGSVSALAGGNLRGFLPSGIGPRAATGGSNTYGGDSLGGDLYYTASLEASIPLSFPSLPSSSSSSSPPQTTQLYKKKPRIFTFLDAGTLASLPSLLIHHQQHQHQHQHQQKRNNCLNLLLGSTRISGGMGLLYDLGGGSRIEATFAIPIRAGPRDATRRVQAGMGLTIG